MKCKIKPFYKSITNTDCDKLPIKYIIAFAYSNKYILRLQVLRSNKGFENVFELSVININQDKFGFMNTAINENNNFRTKSYDIAISKFNEQYIRYIVPDNEIQCMNCIHCRSRTINYHGKQPDEEIISCDLEDDELCNGDAFDMDEIYNYKEFEER